MSRRVELRNERSGRDSRHLWAYVDHDGALHIDGQDLGPATAVMRPDGEYEWFTTIAAADVPSLLAVLGGSPDDDPLEVVARYSGERSYDLERLVRESGVPRSFFST